MLVVWLQDKRIWESTDGKQQLFLYGTLASSTENAMKSSSLEIVASGYLNTVSRSLVGGIRIIKPVYCAIDHLGNFRCACSIGIQSLLCVVLHVRSSIRVFR